MNTKPTLIAMVVGTMLAGGTPLLAHAGDAQKGKDAKGQNACSGKNGCKGKGGDQKPDSADGNKS